MEFRGVGDNHHVAGFNDVFVGLEAREDALVGHIHLIGELQAQRRALLLAAVPQDVGERDDPHVLARAHGVHRGGLSPAAATDHTHPEHARSRHMHAQPGGQPRR